MTDTNKLLFWMVYIFRLGPTVEFLQGKALMMHGENLDSEEGYQSLFINSLESSDEQNPCVMELSEAQFSLKKEKPSPGQNSVVFLLFG